MPLEGKGFYTWQLPNCDKGDPNAIVNAAKQAGLTHVLIKIANGNQAYHGIFNQTTDYITPVVQALHANGIGVWGWHYVYGKEPIGEANIATRRCRDLALEGYVIDAEAEYKEDGKKDAARRFMTQLRSGLPNLPVALSSYRFPSYHPQLPWKEFLDKCDFNMPQVYWIQSHNAGEQLRRSVREFQGIKPYRPIIPTGAAFIEHGWQPTVSEVLDFMTTAKSLNMSAVNFWEWADARSGNLPGLWEVIRDFPWSGAPAPKDICEQYIAALNTRDPNQVVNLYSSTAVHVTAARTISGTEPIRAWYRNLLNSLLPNSTFTLTGYSGTGSPRHLTWTAVSGNGSVQNGNDSLGLVNDKIAYHYSYFTVTR